MSCGDLRSLSQITEETLGGGEKTRLLRLGEEKEEEELRPNVLTHAVRRLHNKAPQRRRWGGREVEMEGEGEGKRRSLGMTPN